MRQKIDCTRKKQSCNGASARSIIIDLAFDCSRRIASGGSIFFAKRKLVTAVQDARAHRVIDSKRIVGIIIAIDHQMARFGQ